jgi:diguanylate cyclase (GGDEF)-like protein/PAS domain S-box-containing protein
MAAKPKTAGKSGKKFKSDTQRSPKNDYSHLSNDMISDIGIGIHIIQEGKFVFVSPLLQKLSGYSKSTLLGQNSLVHVHPEDRNLVKEKAIRCLKAKRKDNYEYRVIKKNGDILWLLEMVAPIQFNGERAVLGSFMDITKHKHEELALRETQNKHGEILESIEEGYYEVNLAGNLTFVNDAIIREWGYSRKELLGMNYRQLADAENAKKLFHSFNEVYRTGNPVKNIEWTIIQKNGTSMHVEASIVPNKDLSGNITGFRGVGRDITERKRMEEALRQSEEKYRSILENIRESYFEVDLAGNYTFFNTSLCRLTGYSMEELAGMNYSQFSDKETSTKVFQTCNRVYKTGEPAEGFDWKFSRKDGSPGHVEASISLRKDPAGNPVGFSGVLRDITERKRMEEDLRQSEEQYRSILENIRESYFEVDLAGNFTFFNDSLCRLTGCSREELVGMNYAKFSDKETSKIVFQTFHKVFLTGEPAEGFDWPTTRKDGIKIYVSASISLRKDSAGKPVGFRGVLRNVTERKRMEEDLRQSEEQYRNILESIRESYFEVDLAGNFTFFNDSLCRLTGCSREELVGMNYAKFSDKETSKIVFQTFHKVFLTGEPAEGFDWPTTRKDGIKIYVSASISLRKDSAGKPVGFRGVLRDVTERKRMEESLRQSEERHRSIIEQMHDGYFEIDLAGNFVHFNEAACQTYGYSKEELMGLNYKQYTDKETGRKLFEVFTELYRIGIPVKAHALELIRKDGTKSFNEISVSLVKNEKGEPIGFRGIARDITERKRSEEQIRHMATHDTLTNLPNRTMFSQLLNHAIRSAKRHQRQLAVLFTDLDGFKNINDTIGHDAGDLLLQTIAGRFKQKLRSTDVVARLGGDEFVILIEEINNPDQLVTVARKILSAAMQPVSLMDGEHRVTASIGISMYPKDGEEEPVLMKAADQAMYFAKEQGKNNYRFYSEVPMSPASK